MKKARAAAALLCVLITMLSFGCGKKPNPTDTTDPALPVPTSETVTSDEKTVKNSVEEMTRLDAAKNNQILVSDGEELERALKDKQSAGVLFRTEERLSLTLSGKHDGKTITVKAPASSIVSESENVSFILMSVGTGGLITDAKAKSIYVSGENVPLTLKAGAENVIIKGAKCSVTFKGGEYGSVTVFNTTTVLTNLSSEPIVITCANGTAFSLPSMQTYYFENDSFEKAKP